MGWFRRNKAETSRSNNYGQEYSNRPIVPPDALYPLINRTLDLIFNFANLGTRFMIQEGIDRTDHPRFSAVWQKEFSTFHASQLELQNAVFALQAVRVSDSESGLMPVH